MDQPKVVVPLAEGFEEIEAVTIVDVLRRAGVEVILAGLEPGLVRGSHGIALETDRLLDELELEPAEIDALVLPGGMPGSQTLHDHPGVQSLIRGVHAAGGRVAAICAAPMALGPSGILAGRTATSFPSFRERTPAKRYLEDRVVIDGPVVTSRGAGTAMEFALALVSELVGAAEAERLAEALLAPKASGAPQPRE